MIEMIGKKQWSRLSRNVALVVLLMIVAASLTGCSKTVVDMKEPAKATPDPGDMVKPKRAKPMAGKAKLPKHLREQAAEKKRTGEVEDKLESLQGFVRDAQKPTPKE